MESLIFLFFGNSVFTVQSWLAWYFLCRPGWSKPETSLSLPLIAGFKGMCYYGSIELILFLLALTARQVAFKY